MKGFVRATVALLTAGAISLSLGTAAQAATPRPRTLAISDMYNQRYCEYLIVAGALPKLTATIWNTYGLDDCPAALWKATDVNALKAEFGALAVVLNGPRYWLMSRGAITLGAKGGLGTVRSFAGLRMARSRPSSSAALAGGHPTARSPSTAATPSFGATATPSASCWRPTVGSRSCRATRRSSTRR